MDNMMSGILDRLTDLENRVALLERSPIHPKPRPEPVVQRVVPVDLPKPEPLPVEKPEPKLAPTVESNVLERMATRSGGWEELIGGNLLNKLGALVLVIGIALFLSYSFTTMGPAGRAFTSAGLSAVLLISGIFVETKERYRAFSRGIMAAGWAGLYFTSYAMYALPAAQIIDNPVVGTMLMIAVALGMIGHSLRYQVQSLTGLAFGCIFAALALSPLDTFVAISLVPLAAAMLYLARRFDWHALALFAAAGTYAVFLTRPATGASLASIQSMLLIFWTMFEAFDLLRLRDRKQDSPLHQAIFAVNAVSGLAASAFLWNRLAPDSMWLFSAGAAILYLASTWIRFAFDGDGETYYEFSLILSAVLTGLAIFARVPGVWMSVGFMLEAETLFLAAHRLRIPVAKALSGAAFAVALAEISQHFTESSTALGGLEVANSTPSLAVMAVLFYLNRYLSPTESYWSYFASAFVASIGWREARSNDWLGLTQLAWSALLFEFGRRTKLREFRVQSYFVAGLSFLITALLGTFQETAWPVALAALVIYVQTLRALRLQDASSDEKSIVSAGGSVATLVLTALFLHRVVPPQFEAVALMAASVVFVELGLAALPADLTWLGRAFSLIPMLMPFLDAPADVLQRITANIVVAALQFLMRFRTRREPLSAAHGIVAAFIIAVTLFNEVSGGMLTLSWSLEGIALLAVGFATRDRWLRISGLSLLLLCIGKVFFYDLRNLETFYRICSFIGLGMILLAVSWIYTRFKEQMQKLL